MKVERNRNEFQPLKRTSKHLMAWLLLGSFINTYFCKPAMAATVAPVAVTTCATCTTQSALLNVAATYVQTWIGKIPPGYTGAVGYASNPDCSATSHLGATIVLVASATVPISGAYYACSRTVHGISSVAAVPFTATTDAQTISADGLILFRSAKTEPITLPSSLPINETPELISAWLSSAEGIPEVGQNTLGLWHALTNMPQLVQGTFVNAATGEKFTIWNGDVITVTDSNGNTAQFKWTPLSTIQWTIVDGSIRMKGIPVGGVQPTGPEPGGAVTVSYPNGPTVVITPFDDTLPRGTITVGDPIDMPGASSETIGA